MDLVGFVVSFISWDVVKQTISNYDVWKSYFGTHFLAITILILSQARAVKPRNLRILAPIT